MNPVGIRYFGFLLSALFILGCSGQEPGTSENWGSEDTNMLVSASVRPETYTVDICNSADTGAIANISTETINEALPENTLYLEKCTVEFSTETADAPPITSWTVYETHTLPVNDLYLRLVDADRKAKYLSDITSGYSPADDFPAYTAKYTFSGHDRYGSNFGFVARTTFSIGKYSFSVSPEAVSLTGLNNPDQQTSDDVTFHICGGTEPYTVYSDNTGIVENPGTIATGVTTFTVDPNAVLTDTTVTLTVVDSSGATAPVTVTVKP